MKKKILILGSARHGKDTVAEMISEEFGYTHKSSSVAALEIFMMDVLNTKYGLRYDTKEEAFEDRTNHRDKWFNEICKYNKEDKLKLTKEILKTADIYVGLRDKLEVEAALKQGTFDLIIGVYNPRLETEDENSNNVDMFLYSDFILMNSGSLRDLRGRVRMLDLRENEDTEQDLQKFKWFYSKCKAEFEDTCLVKVREPKPTFKLHSQIGDVSISLPPHENLEEFLNQYDLRINGTTYTIEDLDALVNMRKVSRDPKVHENANAQGTINVPRYFFIYLQDLKNYGK